jgi:hypothetical protein
VQRDKQTSESKSDACPDQPCTQALKRLIHRSANRPSNQVLSIENGRAKGSTERNPERQALEDAKSSALRKQSENNADNRAKPCDRPLCDVEARIAALRRSSAAADCSALMLVLEPSANIPLCLTQLRFLTHSP